MPKYTRGKYPYTVLDTLTGKLYVRRSVSVGGRQKQIWRVCIPPTTARILQVLAEIEQEIEKRKTLINS